jgi:hypothetical protein
MYAARSSSSDGALLHVLLLLMWLWDVLLQSKAIVTCSSHKMNVVICAVQMFGLRALDSTLRLAVLPLVQQQGMSTRV